jgi:hypothetical protein
MYLQITIDKAITQQQRPLVTTDLLGKAKTPGLSYEQPDGSPYRIDTGYFGKPRDPASPFPGRFAQPKSGLLTLKIWPIEQSNVAGDTN